MWCIVDQEGSEIGIQSSLNILTHTRANTHGVINLANVATPAADASYAGFPRVSTRHDASAASPHLDAGDAVNAADAGHAKMSSRYHAVRAS